MGEYKEYEKQRSIVWFRTAVFVRRLHCPRENWSIGTVLNKRIKGGDDDDDDDDVDNDDDGGDDDVDNDDDDVDNNDDDGHDDNGSISVEDEKHY
ncbi:hypothetical protein PoB_003748800 [Plakobranchus ocellatus]|uniref:Uncharacterized protein n=1 Tax=Plakobranchus ocellatus TaxID=259542 RepID=A0AAV4AVX3_9GAST|nr:hypothetical protein PoB_003748800 [Plakobranchus ocellatus]